MKPLYHCSEASLASGEGSREERLAALKAAGFDGLEGGLPELAACPALARSHRDLGLSFGVGSYFPEEAEPEGLFERAAVAGALYLEAQVDGYWRDDAWVVRRTRALIDLGTCYGVPFFLETHRGRYTQDLRRTLWLLDEIPELRLCGDFSHYTSMGELKAPWSEEWKRGLRTVAARCGVLHGRLNAGQRVQDPLSRIGAAQKAEYQSLWSHALAAARTRGERLVFTTELLPPDYQLEDLAGNRLGDLWEETVELRELARAAFAAPISRGGPC